MHNDQNISSYIIILHKSKKNKKSLSYIIRLTKNNKDTTKYPISNIFWTNIINMITTTMLFRSFYSNKQKLRNKKSIYTRPDRKCDQSRQEYQRKEGRGRQT